MVACSSANERERDRDRECERGRIAEFVDEIIDVPQAMGMSDGECNVEDFISLLEEDQLIVIMTLHWVTNTRSNLTLRLLVGKWKKC